MTSITLISQQGDTESLFYAICNATNNDMVLVLHVTDELLLECRKQYTLAVIEDPKVNLTYMNECLESLKVSTINNRMEVFLKTIDLPYNFLMICKHRTTNELAYILVKNELKQKLVSLIGRIWYFPPYVVVHNTLGPYEIMELMDSNNDNSE